jgi:hypothetical protein
MAEKHPDELELLSFVEDELDDPARRVVEQHLPECPACAAQVRRLEVGRDALRTAPLLELPAARRTEIVSGLPDHRDRWRLFRPVKRALVIAAPVAAAAALVGVFVLGGTQLGGGGDDEAGGDAAAVESTDMERATGGGGQEAQPQPQADTAAQLVRKVPGPPAEIVRILESEGIAAEVEPGQGVFADARAGEVRAALSDLPDGAVAVYVR